MIERLLIIKLEALDCEAEAWLNGMPIARAHAAWPRAIVPVHEYTVEGVNRLELVLWPHPATTSAGSAPAPEPRVATGRQIARLHLLLPRVGNVADESSARTLAQLDWAPEAGVAYQAPLTLNLQVTLPASFPRWRWLDAPQVEPTPVLRQQALAFVEQLATQLAAGDFDGFMSATRLRTEELAAAYQRDPAAEAARMRAHLSEAYAAKRLNWLPMDAETLVLRRLADGRLLECLDASGAPMLRTEPDEAGQTLALPLRLAAVDGRFYVLR